jgi:hypothetical protein
VSPLRYELGFYIPEDDILRSHRRENLKSYCIKAYEFRFILFEFPTFCPAFQTHFIALDIPTTAQQYFLISEILLSLPLESH